MKILLLRNHDVGDINTRLPESLNRIRGIMPPLGLAYIAASLEMKGHEVKILDAQALNANEENIKKYMISYAPEIVGITSMTSNFFGALKGAEIAKSIGALTIMGGPNMEVFPKESLSYEAIDYGISGEGEITTLKLVEAIEQNLPVSDIEGVVYREKGQIKVNLPSFVEDIDSLPFPARHLLPIKSYSSIISLDPMTTMITSRGCPYKCSFCFKQAADKKIRFRNAIKIVDEMENLIEKYHIKEILFYDDTILLKESHIESICKEIIKRKLNIKWESPSRVDKVSLPLLKLMKQSGCVRLRYGVESGDEKILEAMNKKIDLSMIVKAFDLTKQAGIETFAYFITGYLNETRNAFENTMKLIKRINPDQIMMTLTTPYPGTLLEKQAIDANKISRDYWKNFILGKNTSPMPEMVDGAEEWIKEAYRSFYLNPGYVFRRIKNINSFDQFKKHLLAGIGVLFFKNR